MNAIFRLGLVSAALAFGLHALAQEPVVTSSLSASRVESVGGKTVLHPATEARPGDELEYRATYSNHGPSAVSHLLATLPVPPGTTFVADSPLPAGVTASTDERNFAAVPLMHEVARADGSRHLEPVPLSEYRALRWDVGTLNPGKATTVSMHVRIDPPLLSSAALPPLH